MLSQVVLQQYGSDPQILVTHELQPEVSLVPCEHSACEQVPPPVLLDELDELVVPDELDELDELDPPPAMAAPFGVPHPVGPSNPAPALQRYAGRHVPWLPEATS